MGLIMGLSLSNATEQPHFYSDHMNATRMIDDSKTHINQEAKLRHMTGRSYYRWILALVKEKGALVEYTRGHSNETTLPAMMNYESDHYASSSQKHIGKIATAPHPTFMMDDFTFFREHDGWIESNIRNFTDFFNTQDVQRSLGIGNQLRMASWAYDETTPPNYPYVRATSAYSALIQLYARSGQLATADCLHQRGMLPTNRCRFGCEAVEDMHHIFVECRKYEQWRTKAAEELGIRTERKMIEQEIEGSAREQITGAAKLLFSNDESIWPLHYTFYYLGHMPKIAHLIPTTLSGGSTAARKLRHHLTTDWHMASIRLAGRIFGDLQREMAKRKGRNA